MGIEHVGNTGTRVAGTMLIGNEIVALIWDARWMLLAIFICIIADFRFGWGESSKHYHDAQRAHNTLLMEQTRWRTSRALRRSVNKAIDYLVWIVMGMFIGMALLPRFGVDYTWGGAVAAIVAIFCEVKSIAGHFCYLHGLSLDKGSVKSFVRSFLVSLLKKKNEDIGEAVEDGFESMNENKEKEK